MKPLTNALIWATVIILFAILAASGLVENDVAQTMLIILPVLAWTTLGSMASGTARSCTLRRSVSKGQES